MLSVVIMKRLKYHLLLCFEILLASMALYKDLKEMLLNASALLAKQQSAVDGDQFQAIVCSLSDSIVAKVAALETVSVQECEELSAIIHESVFTTPQKMRLNTVLTSRCLTGMHGIAAPAAAGKATTQECSTPSVFLTHRDWAIVGGPHKSAGQKMTTVVNRFRMLGLTNPTENAFQKLAAIIVAKHCPDASLEQMYNIYIEMKENFHRRRKDSVDVIRLARFPDSTAFLPDCVKASGYPDPADQPAGLIIDGIAQITKAIPQRLSNKILRGSTPKGFKTPAAAGPGADALSVIAQALSAVPALQGLFQPQQQEPQLTIFNRGAAGMQYPPASGRMPMLGAPTDMQHQGGLPSSSSGGIPNFACAQAPAAAGGVQSMSVGAADGLPALGDAPKAGEVKDTAVVDLMEAIAAGGGKKDVENDDDEAKAPAAKKLKGKPAAAASVVKAETKAETKANPDQEKAIKLKLVLGCSKCRGIMSVSVVVCTCMCMYVCIQQG